MRAMRQRAKTVRIWHTSNCQHAKRHVAITRVFVSNCSYDHLHGEQTRRTHTILAYTANHTCKRSQPTVG